ncbi:MAG: Crp/Fnr family transcriptional regulator [Rhodobacteraceae bacterium]|nr:Crp/Fnr family transcriptional regulator [Paracoccaceae bacterium]MAY46243.1 Crp/Fnr family transcriptional regulator [Paracoccaceae bacterium]|tara:strand:- start:1132 stop:1818 length:687 start_codon:yes stop_codon:yes gene_type:complete
MFSPVSKATLAFIQKFKTGELVAQPGTQILTEQASSSQLFTALDGMGVRYKTTRDGRRQVVGFVLPGDFVGLQSGVMDVMRHSVEATTEMRLCVFNRTDLWSLFKSQPDLAFDLTHIAANEEHLLGEALTAMGQMDAQAKIAWALYRFDQRLSAVGLRKNGQVPLPYRQQDLADALGLSLVHTNKTLAKLKSGNILTWSDGWLSVSDLPGLAKLCEIDTEASCERPLI